jgi:AcrR family transcriptional regulator
MTKDISHSEARQRIITTALDLFYRQGYLATGINQVIAEAGVSKNTFYYYFPSKEDLCVAYLQERHLIWMGWLQKKIDSYTNPYDRVLGVFEFLDSWLRGCNFRGCAFLNIASEVPDIDHRLRQEVIAHKDELRKVLTVLLEELKGSAPEFSRLDVPLLADTLYLLCEGLISACQNYGDAGLIAGARNHFVSLLASRA